MKSSMIRAAHRGMTLAELLAATCITSLVVAALGVFTKAVMDGCDHATQSGINTQTSRVLTSRIANTVAKSRQVLNLPHAVRMMPDMNRVLMVWERDGDPGDASPDQPNFVETVIFAPSKNNPSQLLELRPHVDPSLVVPLDDPASLYAWIDRFRRGQDVTQPPIALSSELAGIQFDVDEFPEPEGIGGVVQQNIRISLCVSAADAEPTVFFSSATCRYAAGH